MSNEAKLSDEFEARMDRILRDGMRATHNSAIEAAVKMILIHQVGGVNLSDVARAVLELKLQDPHDEHNSPTPSPTTDTPH
jgi:hypothetical protein